MFERNGLTIKITDNMSILDVTQAVIITELLWSLSGNKQIFELIEMAECEADKYYEQASQSVS